MVKLILAQSFLKNFLLAKKTKIVVYFFSANEYVNYRYVL